MQNQTSNFAILNSVDHADLKISTGQSAVFGDAVMQTMVFPFEFRNLQSEYPLFFQTDVEGHYYPVALFGFEDGENLFLEGDNWSGHYVPAMLRRGPFLIGVADNKSAGGGDQQSRVLSIDMSHARVGAEDGEPLFDALGGRSAFLEEQANLLETMHSSLEHCQRFAQALNDAELLEPVTLSITLNDGTQNQLVGLSGVDDEKLQGLSGEVLERFNREGYLLPLFMAVASMSNMRRLIELKNSRVAASK